MSKRILIVDDKEGIRKLVHMTLLNDNYQLFEADNGAAALEMAKIIHPHVVILDIMMPGKLDGFDVCEELKRNTLFNNPIVVMLTALAQHVDIEEGMRAGADSYLTKPFSPLQLIEVIEKALTVSAS